MTDKPMMKCKDCKWWVIHPSELDNPERDKAVNQCQRYPPVNIDVEDGRIEALFPETQDWMFCGEFKKR